MSEFVVVNGRKLEYLRIAGSGRPGPPLVFLHEGLGSISLWRDFPARVAAATGCETIVYSRFGYGQSDLLDRPRKVDYMQEEAQVALPGLLDALGIVDPLLIGHSDGASIALIYAGSGKPARGLILEAPHVFVEDISVSSIDAAKVAFETTDLPQKLGRHHRDPARTFYGWNDIWMHPDFRSWNIEECLPRVHCPVLAIQGLDDEYGTLAQLDSIERHIAGPLEMLQLPDCRHSPHRDQPERTLESMAGFIARVGEKQACAD